MVFALPINSPSRHNNTCLKRHVESKSSINRQDGKASTHKLLAIKCSCHYPPQGSRRQKCPHAPTFTLTSRYHSAKIISYFDTTPTAPVHLHLHMTRDSYESHVSRVKYVSEHVSNIHFYEPPPKSYPPHNSSPSFSAAGCSTASGKLVGCSSCSQPQQRKTINPTFNLYFLLSRSLFPPQSPHSICFSHISFPPSLPFKRFFWMKVLLQTSYSFFLSLLTSGSGSSA